MTSFYPSVSPVMFIVRAAQELLTAGASVQCTGINYFIIQTDRPRT